MSIALRRVLAEGVRGVSPRTYWRLCHLRRSVRRIVGLEVLVFTLEPHEHKMNVAFKYNVCYCLHSGFFLAFHHRFSYVSSDKFILHKVFFTFFTSMLFVRKYPSKITEHCHFFRMTTRTSMQCWGMQMDCVMGLLLLGVFFFQVVAHGAPAFSV